MVEKNVGKKNTFLRKIFLYVCGCGGVRLDLSMVEKNIRKKIPF